MLISQMMSRYSPETERVMQSGPQNSAKDQGKPMPPHLWSNAEHNALAKLVAKHGVGSTDWHDKVRNVATITPRNETPDSTPLYHAMFLSKFRTHGVLLHGVLVSCGIAWFLRLGACQGTRSALHGLGTMSRCTTGSTGRITPDSLKMGRI